MATYHIKGPDGAEYEVSAPEGVSESDVLSHFQSQSAPKAAPDPYANKSPDEIAKAYRQSRLVDAGDKTRSHLADLYVRAENRDASPLGKFGLAVDDVIRTGARGVPVLGGLLDEASAGTSALLGGNYDEALDYQRARDRLADEQPGSTAVQLAGGVAGTVAGARALGVPLGVNSALSLPTRAAIGAGVGSAVGAADMYGRGEGGVGNRSASAGLGAAFGGTVGAAAPVVGQALSSGAQRLADFLASADVLRQLGITREAANVLIRQLSTDDTISATGSARIRQGGQDAMLADAGPAARNLLDTALERSGPGATAAREAIEQRAGRAGQQLNAASDRTFGPLQSAQAREQAVRVGSQPARQSAYDAAYGAQIDYNTPAGQDIARLWARVRPNRRAQANALLEEGGHPPIEDGALPDVRQIDYVTRALNDVAQSGEGQGALGGVNAAGHSAQALSQQMRGALRQAVPEYGTALDTAADPIRRVQAMRFGSSILDKGSTRDDVAREIAGMSAAERREAIMSVRSSLDDVAANVKQMASDANIDARELRDQLGALTSRAAREKITMLLGDPNAARSFFGQLGRSMRALELRASVARNSRTFGRQATDAQVKAQAEPGPIGLALEGNITRAAKKILQGFTGMTPERRLAAEDRLYGEIAGALTHVRGRQAEQRLMALRRAIQTRSNNRNAGQALGQRGAAAFIGAAPTPADRTIPKRLAAP